MKLAREAVENAAFWDLAVCLDCGNQQARQPGNPEAECEECESPRVLPAELILECADALTPDEEA